jgi:hypothetical protein
VETVNAVMTDYEFKIGAYSPKTIPLARLAEYMVLLAELLGEKDRVHFAGLGKGSCILKVAVQSEARIRARRRVNAARSAEPDSPLRKTVAKLNGMLREDNAEGSLKAGDTKVLEFPGVREHTPQQIGPFNKATEIEGVLLRVGGQDASAHALVQDGEGKVWSCEVDRGMARQLAPHIYGNPLRLRGEGRWTRTIEGRWELVRFRAAEFKVLDDVPLQDAVKNIRKAR